MLSGANDDFEIEHMWVLPEYLGRGFGRMLFGHAKRIAHANRARRIRVTADPHAEGFYIKMGMKRIGKKKSSIAGRFLPALELLL